MTDFKQQNEGAINEEAKGILKVMTTMNLRRRGDCLFTIYGSRKIYVSIREFVWTHVKHPYLAECTIPVFTQLLLAKEAKTMVNVSIHENNNTHNTHFYLGESLEQMCQIYLSEIGDDVQHDNEYFKVMKYKFPEDTSRRKLELNEIFREMTLGDLGFTEKTQVWLH